MNGDSQIFSGDDLDRVLVLQDRYDVIWRGQRTRARYAVADIAVIVAAELSNTRSSAQLRAIATGLVSGNYPTKKQLDSIKRFRPRMEQIANSG